MFMHKVKHLKLPEIFTNHLRKLKLFTRSTPVKNKVLNIFFLESTKNSAKIFLHLEVLNHGLL